MLESKTAPSEHADHGFVRLESCDTRGKCDSCSFSEIDDFIQNDAVQRWRYESKGAKGKLNDVGRPIVSSLRPGTFQWIKSVEKKEIGLKLDAALKVRSNWLSLISFVGSEIGKVRPGGTTLFIRLASL